MRKIFVIISIFTFAFMFGCSSNTDETKAQSNQKIMDYAVSKTITDFEELNVVQDSAIKMEGNRLSLTLNVHYDVNTKQAKVLGTQMTERLKEYIEEKAGNEENSNFYDNYDLAVTVIYPNDTVVVHGTKASVIDEIQWDSIT